MSPFFYCVSVGYMVYFVVDGCEIVLYNIKNLDYF